MLERYTRRQVFTVHLLISLAIFAVLAAIMYWRWFPGPFFAADGGWQGVRIVAAVDLVLGPSLTLLLYNANKKTHRQLLIDLVAIALVQMLALSWGVWTTYNQRTIAVVFSEGTFYSLSRGALSRANEQRGVTGTVDIATLDARHHPGQLYAQPYPGDEYGGYLASLLNGEPELHLRPERFQPLAAHWNDVLPHAIDVTARAAATPRLEQELAQRDAGAVSNLVFFPLTLRFGDALIAFDAQTHQLRDIVVYRAVD